MSRALPPVRWWVRLYTAGLPPIIREERRAELESDLWEHSRHGSELGLGSVAIARSVWTRWLLGIPDDLAWRVELTAGRSVPTGRSRGRLVRLSAGVAAVIALVLVIVAINTVQFDEGTQPSGGAASILLLLAIAMAVLGTVMAARGFRVMGARRAEGALVAMGRGSGCAPQSVSEWRRAKNDPFAKPVAQVGQASTPPAPRSRSPSAGTTGARMVKDLTKGSKSSWTMGIIGIGDRAYSTSTVYRTDGMAKGTRRVHGSVASACWTLS